jgi:PAS domain S-box-containing protein
VPKILIVEDERIVAADLKRQLEALGHQISCVASRSDTALEAVKQDPPDLVLMDIRLEDSTSGLEAARAIWDDYRIPVIFLTAYADRETLDLAQAVEPFGYIVKPFSPDELNAAITVAMHQHRSAAKLEESRAWLAALLRSLPDAVIGTDLAGRVRLMNCAAETLVGQGLADAAGKPIAEVLRSDRGSEVLRIRRGTLVIERGSERIPVETTSDDIRDLTGRALGIVVTLRELSQ